MDTIFSKSSKGRNAINFTLEEKLKGATLSIPEELLRDGDDSLELPDVPEVELIRHYIGLSKNNYGVDNGPYPLGSCTMKYNPKINEVLVNDPGFRNLHPLQGMQDSDSIQGILKALHDTRIMLAEITGMDDFTLQPAAGAHGEFTGIRILKDYLVSKGLEHKDKIIVPDTAHGTNPASAAACNFEVIEIESNEKGLVNLEQLKEALKPGDVAGIMLTNPNTLGLFEEDILEITRMVHEEGGLCYYDGANLNGLCGICRPGDMGLDIIHLNLHKTFSTPHGGGGPGSGPVGVKSFLKEFLPGPKISFDGSKYLLDLPENGQMKSVKAFHGNIGVVLKAYFYILSLGLEGLRKNTRLAVLNANYLKEQLKDTIKIPYPQNCYHEFVGSDEGFPNGVCTE
ncbi:MAG: aminomethyl-transferring glycine dehydrogenase subunit GcvPB, partial [Candidatus Hodarchaeota archaeon]